MLAYVFWHRPSPDLDVAEYEAAQRTFHDALAAAEVPGLRGSSCHRLQGATWLAGDRWYEDRYTVAGSWALDVLNREAVSDAMREAHRAAAAGAAAMAAGIYQFRAGDPDAGGEVAWWFSKPSGESYPALADRMATWTSRPGYSLWRRFMVLGPAAEFCLLGPLAGGPPPGPAVIREVIHRRMAWEDR